ncbi:MAG: tRNA uridine-5-carboxymethylaminomethyl(34) synthesis GTPase MnmE [Bacteroidaceae bacterium]|nr:tRNA uridine-5-carboxymethylaminomethyl(34) synthesis GTPase MnmE [Bacteroidaceae bacterium]
MERQSTICAPATATGGAISIIRISGPDAVSIANSIFSKDIADAQGYTLHYGEIPDVDDVVLSVYREARSYTGEDCVEISCHGSRYIVQTILELLCRKGCRLAMPGEFTKRAFLNGKLDLAQAEAVADLISSTNKATHQMAMSQMRGGFSQELEQLRLQILHLTSLLELELDFSDHEDIEFADRAEICKLNTQLLDKLQTLAESFKAGNALKNGIPVAIIGAPNVGKSTLLNALLKEDKAIVSEIQGTTRDLIEDTVQIEGITFRFIDTAGIRKTTDMIEQLGIERSIRAARNAQIVILLSQQGIPFPDISELEEEGQPMPAIIRVLNKCDLTLPDSSYLYHRQVMNQDIHISSKTGAGLQLLTDALIYKAQVPHISQNDVIVTNARHHHALTLAIEDIRRTQQALADNLPGDLIAEDLRHCIHHLAEITGGEITSDEVLHNIFKNFCVGK